MIVENLKYKENIYEGITLENDKYLLQIVDIHEQDCCENHYIEWGYGLTQITYDMRFTFNTDNIDALIEEVPEYGIRLIPSPGTGHPIDFPGYGYNNGHYSSNLGLFVQLVDKENSSNEYTDTIDIEHCQYIRWD